MKLFGSILMGVGILIAGVSGLCALVFLPEALDTSNPYSESMAYSILFIGVIPCAIGIGLFFLGRKLVRDHRGGGGEGPVA